MPARDSGGDNPALMERQKVTRQTKLAREVIELRRENARLQARLAEIQAIVEINERASRILGIGIEPARPGAR